MNFFFENRRLSGQAGDSIAKALFDAGVKTLSYSVKYKRPRSVHCARGRCVMCHMEVDGVPGVPTCITPVEDGMRVRREDFRPFFAPLLIFAVRAISFPAGFYYRMFTKPAFLRNLFLGSLRRMAGVGRLRVDRAVTTSAADNPVSTTTLKPRYDMVVIGAGLAGMSAAYSAARGGASVLLVDEYHTPGGHSIGFHGEHEIASIRDDLVAKTWGHSSIDFRTKTTAHAFYPPHTLLLGPVGPNDGERRAASQSLGTNLPRRPESLSAMHRVEAANFIFATGAYDIIPLFDDNDTPGILGERAIRLLIERDKLIPGSRAVAYGTGPALYDLSRFLLHHNIAIAAVVDAGEPVAADDRELPNDIQRIYHSRVSRAAGREWLSSVRVTHRDAATGRGSRDTTIACDLLCIAFEGQGAYELAYQAGFKFEFSPHPIQENNVMLPSTRTLHSENGVSFFVVGELAGQRSWRDKVTAGEEAAAKTLQRLQASEKD
ncbi:MAG: 2Fe-2S iron-sulfur cluster-binding protein [Candidatus Krumholzibacteria bacterium]|nr:2Fe-2S iron-sulfur cluster-binding protein [Candidatus Krumholzibacteria bacterium]